LEEYAERTYIKFNLLRGSNKVAVLEFIPCSMKCGSALRILEYPDQIF